MQVAVTAATTYQNKLDEFERRSADYRCWFSMLLGSRERMSVRILKSEHQLS